MKIVAVLGFVFLASSAATLHAEPTGPVTLKVNVISVGDTWAKVDYAGKRVKVPSRSLAGKRSGPTDINLTPDQYNEMKRGYFLATDLSK